MKLTKEQLKTKIIAGIYENHTGKITGAVLQEILLDMVDSLDGETPQPGTASFTISEFAVTPTTVIIGTDINVTGKIKNTGTAAGSNTVKIELKSNSAVVSGKTVNISSLAPGATYNLSEKITTSGLSAGTYSVNVSGTDISQTQGVTISKDTTPADVFQISGIVTLATGQLSKPLPVQGVSVQIKGLLKAVTTNAKGAYTIPVSPSTKALNKETLVFTYKTYSVEEAVKDRSTINIVVKEEGSVLDIKERLTRYDQIKEKYSSVLKEDSSLLGNLERSASFVEKMAGIDADSLISGKMNDEIFENYLAVTDPIFEIALKQSSDAAKYEKQLDVNMSIIYNNTVTLVEILAETVIDISKSSNIAKFFTSKFPDYVANIKHSLMKELVAELESIVKSVPEKEILSKAILSIRG